MGKLFKSIKYFILCTGIISLFSCVVNTDNKDDEDPSPTPEPVVIDADKANIKFINNSKYSVCVYDTIAPVNDGSKIDITVGAGETTVLKNFTISDPDSRTVFYFEYLLKIGNATFPYFHIDNHQKILLEKGKENTVTISDLESCDSSSGYILLENLSPELVYLRLVNQNITPYGKSNTSVSAKESAVYEINQRSGIQLSTNFNLLKLRNNAKDFEVPNITPEKGKIYTFTFDGTQVSLKSITPFNIDTQKKIWSRYSKSSSDIDISAVRPMKNLSEGYLAACSSKNYPYAVIMKKINAYGQTVDSRNVGIEEDGSGNKVLSISCQDFMEAADGSCVMLCKLTVRPKTYEDENGQIQNVTESDGDDFDFDEWFLWKYNFTTARLDFSLNLSSSLQKNGEALVDFSNGSQNILIELSDGVYALAGLSVSFDNEENQIINELLLKYDSDSKNLSINKPYSANLTASDENGENLVICAATSLFYSKKDDCIYASDFYNWYTAYDAPSGKPQYISRVRKYDTDLNLVETVCQQENALYLAINGDSESGKYYVCGEVCESGKILKGLLISSANIKDGSVLKSYSYKTDNYPFAWFSNVCICGSNIVASGHAASKRDSQDLPVVVSFSPDGDLQWENTAYTNYKSAPSCFATSIGTYLIHLKGVNSNGQEYSSIVSADLLGNDTGNTAELK